MSEQDPTDIKLREALRQADEPKAGMERLIAKAMSSVAVVSEAARDVGYAMREVLPSRKLKITFTDTSAPASEGSALERMHGTTPERQAAVAARVHSERIATAAELREGSDAAMLRADAIVRSGGTVVRLPGASGPRR